MRLLRAHGERPRYHHLLVGSTARLDALQAAVLRRKLTRLDGWNDERRWLAAELRARITTAGAGGSGGAVVDPVRPPFLGADHVHHLFVVRCEQRDALRRHLAERGVATGVHYPVPIHRTAAYAGLGLGPGSLPVSEALAERICSLPMFPGMSAAELQQVAKALASFTATVAVDTACGERPVTLGLFQKTESCAGVDSHMDVTRSMSWISTPAGGR